MQTTTFTGRILHLVDDAEKMRRQLMGEDITEFVVDTLLDSISTDEITPAQSCYYWDETLALHAFTGLRLGDVEEREVAEGGFEVVVAGNSMGCGSSRETAPFSLMAGGVRLIIAKSFERIFSSNAHDIGLYTSTDFSLLKKIKAGEEIPLSEFTKGLDPLSADVLAHGGLFGYSLARLSGDVRNPVVDTQQRSMTIVEKIIASHAVTGPKENEIGVTAVKPDDSLFIKTDLRFTHDYVTAMAESLWRRGFGEAARIKDPKSVHAFRDHLVMVDEVLADSQKQLLDVARRLPVVQREFCKENDVSIDDEVVLEDGSHSARGICHNLVAEEMALPGQVVIGTDSHTCTAGALGCFAFGVGSTAMANAWHTKDVRVKVPETVKVELVGSPSRYVSAKDVMLHLLSLEEVKECGLVGKAIEFCGEGLSHFTLDEHLTLTNMAVEAGAFTGVMAPSDSIIGELSQLRKMKVSQLKELVIHPDVDATYLSTIQVNLSELVSMVATPGDPKNGVTLNRLLEKEGDISVDIAYAGSCTGGKLSDMEMYASVFKEALERGDKVAENTKLYVQFGSQLVKQKCVERGYVEIFTKVGATLLEPSCGACINAGPGVSTDESQVTVSAINRNFSGRSGPGKVYLASPWVVGASAIAGRLINLEFGAENK